MNALKVRLNQDSAGAAEQLENIMRQIEDGNRDHQFEVDKLAVLTEFVRTVLDKVNAMCDNSLIVDVLEAEALPEDEQTTGGDGFQLAELQRKKRELRRKVLMEKSVQKLKQQCNTRANLIGMELQRVQEHRERVCEDLNQAENRIDSGLLHIRTLEAELAKLRLTVEMSKGNLVKAERSLVHRSSRFRTVSGLRERLSADLCVYASSESQRATSRTRGTSAWRRRAS